MLWPGRLCSSKRRLLYFDVPGAELLRRLAARHPETYADALTVSDRDVRDFEARFDPPCGEGEERIPPVVTPAG